MVKLRGKAKAAFLRRMARGRAAAARDRKHRRRTKAEVARSRAARAHRLAHPLPDVDGPDRRRSKRGQKRKNPQLLVITNPKSKAALAAYRRFHGIDPVRLVQRGRGKNPKVMVAIGDVVEVVYEPRKGQRKRVHWVHRFKRRALLLASADGKELRVIDSKGAVLVDFDQGIIG